jgi:uncharacterized membrane protein YjjP (DUF1212 family)
VHAPAAPIDAEAKRRASLVLLQFLSQLGHALLASGDTVAFVEDKLRCVAQAQGAENVNIVALPTVLFLKFDDGDETRRDFTSEEGLMLRFDQIDALYVLADEAQARRVTPEEGLVQLREILRRPPVYSAPWGVFGHVLVTVGLALVLQPRPGTVAVAAAFGLLVGVLKVVARGRGLFETLLPSLAAFLVASISLIAVKHGIGFGTISVLIASLVTFLPGGQLAIAITELAYGDVVSGASRFVTGLVKLMFLALGMLVATSLVGLPADKLLGVPAFERLGAWAPWLGVGLFALGHALHFSVPLGKLPWLLAVVIVAQVGQTAGGAAFGGYMGGFCGALAMTPVAYFLQYRLDGPPAIVTFSPGLWLLVPGSLGLIGLTEFAADDRLAGIDNFVTTVFTITAIALGSMLGLGLYNALFDPILVRAGALAQSVVKHGKFWR